MIARTSLHSLAIAMVTLTVSLARAQEDPRKSQADALFQEGLKLHDKDKEGEALEKFKKAYEVLPSPNALFWIAREEHLLGRTVDALGHYRSSLKNPLLHPGNQKLAKEYIAALEKHFGRVTVLGPPGTTVKIGNVDVRLPMEEPVDVEAGPLTIRGDREGRHYEGEGLPTAGSSIVIELKAMGEQEPARSSAPPNVVEGVDAQPSMRAESGFWTTGHTVGVAAGAVALVALGAGVGFRLAASGKGDDVDKAAKDASARSGCIGVPSAACKEVLDGARAERDYANASTAFLIAGGVAAAVSVGTFLFWPKSSASSRAISIAPIVATSSGGAFFHGVF